MQRFFLLLSMICVSVSLIGAEPEKVEAKAEELYQRERDGGDQGCIEQAHRG